MEPIDYEQLDPGIRGIVRTLREAGFETTDSGDGVSKLGAGIVDDGVMEVLDMPHVAAKVSVDAMVGEAQRLQRLLGEDWTVEASYSARERTAILFAYLLDNEDPRL